MNEDLEAFRDALREAGQPWSRRGVGAVAIGIVGLVISQVAPSTSVFYVAIASAIVVMVGWVFLVLAFLKRRRWARANPIHVPTLADPGPL
jgi:L-asparagine transporter-like permease